MASYEGTPTPGNGKNKNTQVPAQQARVLDKAGETAYHHGDFLKFAAKECGYEPREEAVYEPPTGMNDKDKFFLFGAGTGVATALLLWLAAK